jgi:hypothetical protein
MADLDNDLLSPFPPLYAELARMRKATLKSAIDDVDLIIGALTDARQKVAQGRPPNATDGDGDVDAQPQDTSTEADAHWIGMTMMNLQNPVKARMEDITNDLKNVTKAQKGFGKALDRALPHRELPVETDAMAKWPALINRAIIMHLLREGQFNVASTFLEESQGNTLIGGQPWAAAVPAQTDEDGDDEMHSLNEEEMGGTTIGKVDLQGKFAEMYRILSELRDHKLLSAIQWAQSNSEALTKLGSNIEFELSKLQFVWLFKGPAVNGLAPENNGPEGALNYARRNFARFQKRHLREIEQLCCGMVYAPNLEDSPYHHIFQIDSAFEDVSLSFTRDFCSLLGLSAESPLYMAVAAGAIALPRLIKYTTYMREKKTEWTTVNELAFETPLPKSMIYHPIFVCPVSKEQTTEYNPPMLLSCGHVICKDSLQNLAKGSKYKCPYCPSEGNMKEPMRIML